MADPIWKDVTFTINRTEADYRIRLNDALGKIIYSGRAYARPGESSVKIRINDICADYIQQSLPVWGQAFTPSNFSRLFYVEYWNGTIWNLAGTKQFYYDWSYDYHYLASRDGFSFPVSNRIDGRMFVPVTVDTSSSTVTATINFRDGTSSTVTLTVRRTASFNSDFNTAYAVFEMGAVPGTAVLDLSDYSDVASVTIAGTTYLVDEAMCHNYALYYVNAYGGWDAMLMRGNVQERDNYTRYDHAVEYVNTSVEARGRRNFVNEIDKTFTMNTGWLPDEGAARMHHLLGSTLVVMHDLMTGDMVPVTITNAECPYKTYKGEGNRLVNYAVEVSVAQERTRR